MKITRAAAGIAAATIACTVASHVAAQEVHRHEPGTAVHALKLNAGHKWATDAPLRQGMMKIRAAVEPKLEALHASKLATRQYKALGAAVETQLAYIVHNCKLDAQADAVLHVILADLAQGADALQGKSKQVTPTAGAVKILAALDDYGTYFDHPGWHALPPEH